MLPSTRPVIVVNLHGTAPASREQVRGACGVVLGRDEDIFQGFAEK